VFALSHSVIKQREGGINDGLVRYDLELHYAKSEVNTRSVASSQWGDYKGTLVGVSHLDLINWTNRLKWFFWELTGSKRK
jgi:triacylglycerol lipase